MSNCFEFVELAVDTSFKRRGFGSTLHDFLLENVDHHTSILTTGTENSSAVNLYRKKGWKVIKSHAPVTSEADLQMILVKEIN